MAPAVAGLDEGGWAIAFEREPDGLMGRPLAGTYTLTIPGRPEMDWRNLENVQVLLRYTYWTRQR